MQHTSVKPDILQHQSQASLAPLDPTILVIFGITGDLSQRYLLPALYHLIKDGLLHEQTEIVGISRQHVTAEQLLDQVELCVNEVDNVCDPGVLAQIHKHTRMFQMDLDDQAAYHQLLALLNQVEAEKGVCMNRLYYLSIPPQVYAQIVHLMGQADLNTSCPHGQAMTRLLVEKPFGHDTASARILIDETAQVFGEEQIFRIDHYLAKETVQNILTFRFENPIFEAVWNHRHIASIEVSASEQIGIEGRARFYEPLGALRDFIQSHLLQILAVITMDRPEVMDSHHIHASKQAVMAQMQAITAEQVNTASLRGQYEGYRAEVKNTASTTETFAAIRLSIDNDRWRDVPILLWTGKALRQKRTEITVTIKDERGRSNRLCFRIQPNEGIELDLLAKKPGFDSDVQPVIMDYSYTQQATSRLHPDAYERVLADAVRGDHTLFATSHEVLEAWRVVEAVVQQWSQTADGLALYAAGTNGHDLLKSSGTLLIDMPKDEDAIATSHETSA